MLIKSYYYKYGDVTTYSPFTKLTFSTTLQNVLELENLNSLQLPSDITSNTIYNELFSLVLGKYENHAIIKIEKYIYEAEPNSSEKEIGLKNFFYKYVSLLNDTYEYYTTLLSQYKEAKAHLMEDVKASSTSKVKFNDTPQSANTEGIYEGDDYITHFTKTEGENSSPLNTKIMRLKEIQDNYRDLMSEWVRDFERIFYTEEC